MYMYVHLLVGVCCVLVHAYRHALSSLILPVEQVELSVSVVIIWSFVFDIVFVCVCVIRSLLGRPTA